MIFRHFLLDVNEANAFLVACEQTREALLVDVGEWSPAFDNFLEKEQLRLTKIFITHDHYDHTGGLAEALHRHNPEVFAGSASAAGCQTRPVGQDATIHVGALVGRVVLTPGHTPDGRSLILPGMVFTGDALFCGSVGGTATPVLAKQQIDHIRRNIFTLPPEYEIHCGHGPSSTVAVESRYNPFFST